MRMAYSPRFFFTDGTSYWVRLTTTLPGAPRNLREVVDGASMTLSWDAPRTAGGSPITGYKYRLRSVHT